MALFNKKKKRKKKEKDFLNLDDEDLGGKSKSGDYGPAGLEKEGHKDEGGDDSGLPGLPGGGSSPEKPSSFGSRDMELLQSKMSALKSEMGALKQRLKYIESKLDLDSKEKGKIAKKYGSSKPKDTGWHY